MWTWPVKDPDENLDYQFDWTNRLEDGETIATSQFILEDGDITIADDDIDGGRTTVWLSGGTSGVRNTITNRITTSEGRIWDESVRIRVRNLT